LRTLRAIEFLDSAKKGQLTFVVFHVLGSSIESLNEIKDLSDFTTDCKYFPVKNFINETTFFEWDQVTHSSYFKKFADAVEISIPKLNERAYEEVELASVPFATFIANKKQNGDAANNSFVLRGYVRHWLGQVWDEYDRIKLKEIVADANTTTSRPRVQAVKSPESLRKSEA
jgi:hypothetical protein